MTECWNAKPTARPKFSDITDKIEQYLSAELGYLSLAEVTSAGDDVTSPFIPECKVQSPKVFLDAVDLESGDSVASV